MQTEPPGMSSSQVRAHAGTLPCWYLRQGSNLRHTVLPTVFRVRPYPSGMDEAEARRRFTEARIARLGTVRDSGDPHLVPFVFALQDDTIYSAVDEKPKRTRHLQRLANIAAHPRVTALVDQYEESWDRLWWVRVDGRARVMDEGPERDRALELLAARYLQYRHESPTGPAVIIDIDRWRFWPAD